MTAWRTKAALALAATLVLAGCGRDASGGAGDVEAENVAKGPAQGTIDVWAMGAEAQRLDTFAKKFEKQNPKANVQITAIPWDSAHDKIATAIAGGTTPDISVVGTTWMGEFAATGGLEPTPDLIDSSTFFQGAWNTTVSQGTSYGVPWYVDTRVLYYRKDLAKKAGFTEPPATWDQLRTMAQGMQQKAGAKWGMYLQPGKTGSWQTYMPFAWQAGGSVVKDGRFTFSSSAQERALSYYNSFFEKGLSPSRALEGGVLEQRFIDGELGAFVSGPWHIELLREQGGKNFMDKVGVAMMPAGPSGARTSFIGGGNMVVFNNADNRDAAWKFIDWLSQADTQLSWYQEAGGLPAVKKAWDSPELSADPLLAVFGKQLEDAKSPPAIPTWEQIASVLDTEIEKTVKGGKPVADALRTVQQKVSAIGTGS